MDHKANLAYYDAGQNAASQILSDPYIPSPASARRFIEVLTAKTPATGESGSRTASRSQSSAQPAPEAGEARTYGIDDAPEAGGEAIF
jgi:hypothetical protein